MLLIMGLIDVSIGATKAMCLHQTSLVAQPAAERHVSDESIAPALSLHAALRGLRRANLAAWGTRDRSLRSQQGAACASSLCVLADFCSVGV